MEFIHTDRNLSIFIEAIRIYPYLYEFTNIYRKSIIIGFYRYLLKYPYFVEFAHIYKNLS